MLRQLWLDQGFKEDDNGNLISHCPKCSNETFIAHPYGLLCSYIDCGYSMQAIDYLMASGKYDSENKALKAINFYLDSEKSNDENPNAIAGRLAVTHRFFYCKGQFYQYHSGSYKPMSDIQIDKYVKEILKSKFSRHKSNEVQHSLAVDTFIEPEKLNNDPNIINLKNGLLDLDTLELGNHTAKYLSTIQLNILYDKEAGCPLWFKTLDEIFESNFEKIGILQEFMGYCLRPDNRFQTALFNIGEGANGKSLILNTLNNILGPVNCSSVQLDNLNDRHYLAALFNKLVNISIESEAKSVINDSMFKAITAGDPITVDEKYGQPFSFRPFCRMVFAMNDLPRVEDKTDAFFRRLIILRYNRQFKSSEQDRGLENKLKAEYSGILNWMIAGMKRLYERGYFGFDDNQQNEIAQYRIENNNILLFIRENIYFEKNESETKSKLYQAYVAFCHNNGCRPLSMIKFCKEFKKACPSVKETRSPGGQHRIWEGACVRPLIP